MRDFPSSSPSAPIGYFVHHQGRGHALRCAAVVNALPEHRPVTIFCARNDIFPAMRPGVEIRQIPSLFEPQGDEAPGMASAPVPDTLHCAPLGWPSIRNAMAEITSWFAEANPSLMIGDVSAELAQLSRICSVPHVSVLQHGTRSDPGHQAGYDCSVGLLAPFSERLAQPDWTPSMRKKTHFAAGLGASTKLPKRQTAREMLGIREGETLVLVLSGGGGTGFAQAPLGIGARAVPDTRWITIGTVQRDWHATEPGNIEHHGWVDTPDLYLAAADVIISSTGNNTCAQVLATARPWLAVPEWRYFDEQVEKARALQVAGAATMLGSLPSSAQAWRTVMRDTIRDHDPQLQRSLLDRSPAEATAGWLEGLIEDLWQGAAQTSLERTIA
ncbi:Glycosyltransferase family 28 C-terminal domain-containing protein [Poseidonocella pacifica]|uniref:Glycosyltransferase family 28 C-terminal domain-containing protein n=1 Tax=Poseidonocella pacifica TaxID=871651 RepID=A0A1I0X5Q9_9RHOB|nr:glycosyltransferase [Poseidonocella pacifica]SFA95987.1 Glycosyltransferase family 28 C-terminal domain-containing protein [Poseidonocella pacifica]